MNDFIGSQAFAEREARHQGGRFPQPGYLASTMMMFDRYEHELAAYQWLEYQISPEALLNLLHAFPGCPALAHAAIAFDGSEIEIVACEQLESSITPAIMEEFWDRFLQLIIDRNTLILI